MITRISLSIFAVVFVASGFMPSAPGGLFLVYVVLCTTSLVATITSTKKMKSLAVALFIFSVGLTVVEYQNGNKTSFKERAKQLHLNQEKP